MTWSIWKDGLTNRQAISSERTFIRSGTIRDGKALTQRRQADGDLRKQPSSWSPRGFHGTPMSQVAKKSGVAVGTIYQYFPGKEDLISTLYLEVKRRLAQSTLLVYSPQAPVHDGFRATSAPWFVTVSSTRMNCPSRSNARTRP